MEDSLPGSIVTFETRSESNEKVDRKKRYEQILYILSRFPNGLTAKQVAVQMKKLGYTGSDDRNCSAPRLNELSHMGKVEPIGKVKCEYTGTKVSVYRLRKESEQLTIAF